MPERYWYTTLYLIRHAQARASDGSYDESTPLSELGRLQAARLVDELVAGSRPTAVYTSPYPRAVETAAPLCRKLGV
jgi:broad specificity phosphatase PhoE